MNQAHIKAILEGVVPEVKAAIALATKPLLDRIDALEQREPIKGEKGDPGIDGHAGARGDAGRDGIDGKDGAAGLDGKDAAPGRDGADGLPGRDGADGKDGAPGRDGKDGDAGVEGKPGDRGLPGEKGLDGKDGRDGLPGRDGQAGLQGEKGIDGKDGRDGIDGFGFDDLTAIHDGERGITLRFARGEQVKEFSFELPIVIDRGVWRPGTFKRGDGVTWGGSFFIAQRPTSAKPETPEAKDDWRLAVKRGKDGKDGKPGERGGPGAAGAPGRDLTQMTFTGEKY